MTHSSIYVVKTTLALLLLVCLTSFTATAQTVITGTVVDQRTGNAIPGVEVRASGESTSTDAFGGFELKVNVGAGQPILLTVSLDGYQDYQVDLENNDSGYLNAGRIRLQAGGSIDLTVGDELIPTITLSSEDLEGGSAGVQNISGVLTASRDAFINAAAFTFGPARFNIRGYDAQYTNVLMNGMPLNDMETGRIYWNHWGGLNDVMRNRSNVVGLGTAPFFFGGVGGTSIIDTRASNQRKQLRASYAISNRSYRNRLMLTYSSGMLENGWAFTFSGSRRWADEGYVEGTFYDAFAYFMSVDKKLNDNHMLNLTAFGAPIKRGKITGITAEMAELAGTNYYNPNWGYQNGEKRNSRVRDEHQPMAMLRHDWKVNDQLNLSTTLGFQTGFTGNSALDWYNAPDPRPNYYRFLPSFIQGTQKPLVEAAWRNNESVRQVNWDQMYQVNYGSLQTVENANGIEGNTVTGLRSQYVVEDRRTDITRGTFNSTVEAFLSDQVSLHGGVTYQQQVTANYKLLDDLLGGDFYLDVDRFAEFDSSGIFVENNVDVPNRIVRQGDRFGYDYDYHIRQASAWLQLDVSLRQFDFFLAAQGANTRFWRNGKVANGKFPTTSAGDSEKSNFGEYAIKAGATYKIDGRNYLLVNAAYQTRAPYVRDAFVSPRTRNQKVDNLTQEKIASIEGGYLLRSPNIKARAIGYYTRFQDQIYNRSFFLDNAIRTEDGSRGGFVNYIMTGIETEHMGLELAAEVKVTPTLRATAVAAIGQYIFKNRPNAIIYLDQLAETVSERQVYIENFYIAGTPQQAYTFGLSYNSPKYWFANINFNYFNQSFLDFYPERRTTEAISYVDDPQVQQEVVTPDSPLWNQILDQEKLPTAFTVDFFGGKSWKIDDYFIYLNVGISNILNKQDFITGGYEQFRFDFEGKDVGRFPNNYFYSYGRTYFISLAVRI